MKKKTMILLTAVLCASVGALVMFLNRPYKPVSFTVDGDQWSAKTVDGGSLLLELQKQRMVNRVGTRNFCKRLS